MKLAAADAAAEKRIAKLKADHAAATTEDRAFVEDAGNLLAQFIMQYQDLFLDPRKIKTSLGSFGLQAASELVIENKKRLEQMILDHGYDDCFQTILKLVKPAIRKRLESGEKIPGVRIVAGDVAVYKVDKSLVDQARQNAG